MVKAKVYFGKADISLRVTAKTRPEVVAALSEGAFRRVQETISRLIDGDMFGLDEALACTASAAAIAEKVTAQDIEGMDGRRLRAKVLKWLRAQGVEVGKDRRVRDRKPKTVAASKQADGTSKVGAALAMGASRAITSDENKPLPAEANTAIMYICRLLPRDGGIDSPPREFSPTYKSITMDVAAQGAFTKALFGSNRPETRKRLEGVLNALARRVTSTTTYVSNGNTVTRVIKGRLLDWTSDLEIFKNTEGVTLIGKDNITINVSSLFYLCLKRYENVDVGRWLEAARAKNGNAYVYIRSWGVERRFKIEAQTAAGKDFADTFPYSYVPKFNTTTDKKGKQVETPPQVKQYIRDACKAVAQRAADDMGATQWKVVEGGISFLWKGKKRLKEGGK